MILDHPYQFFFAFFSLTLALGFWLGHKMADWRIKRLKMIIQLMKAWR